MDKEKQHISPIGLLPRFLAGEATPEERKVVNKWLSADPANRNEFDAFSRLWELTGSVALAEDIDVDKEWQRMTSVISSSPGRIRYLRRTLQVAAAIIVASSLTFLGFRLTGPKTVKSPLTVSATFMLPDGTSVSMNAASKITYRKGFGITHRNLRLKGEAYFIVPKNTLPFTVSAGDASVRVTGTEFNVKAYGDRPLIKVTVVQGKVKLYQTDNLSNETNINTGETGIYNRVLKTVSSQAMTDGNDLSWKTGIIDLRKTPLSEVAEILANTYHLPVEIDPIVADCLVTVSFDNQELDQLLEVLKSTLDLVITKKGKRITISGKGC